MKRKTINRPHWKKLAEKRNDKIRTLRRALYRARKEEVQHSNATFESAGAQVSKKVAKLKEEASEKEMLEETVARLRNERDDWQRLELQRQRRVELLRPALEIINQLIER